MKPVHAALLALLFVVLGAVACGDQESPPPATRPSDGVSASPSEDPSPEPEPSESSEDRERGTVVELEVAGGKVSGVDDVVEVRLGETLEIRVTSDVDEEVHVHGYDRTAELKAGETTTLRFKADIPGVFEVELEESGSPLFELRVQ